MAFQCHEFQRRLWSDWMAYLTIDGVTRGLPTDSIRPPMTSAGWRNVVKIRLDKSSHDQSRNRNKYRKGRSIASAVNKYRGSNCSKLKT